MSAAETEFLFEAGEAGYLEATSSFNLLAELTPDLAGTVTDVTQIRAALAAARVRGTGVRVHATGHAALAQAPFKGETLLRVRMAEKPTVDPAAATATIPAGATWGEVVEVTAPHGLTPLHGSSGTVGAIGYLLRGGMSFYGRLHGLASNSILSLTVVLADGSVVTVDRDTGPELFWALRGGGGGLGIVVSATVSLIKAPTVTTGAAFWPFAAAPALLEHWERWCADAPENASTSFRVMNLPPLPGLPPQLTAGSVVCVDGAVVDAAGVDAERTAAELLAPLRAIAEPLLDTWHPGGPADVLATHMDPPEPVPALSDHLLVERLGARGRAAFLAAAGEASLTIAELRQLGGAFARPNPDGGAVDALRGAYAYFGAGIPGGPVTPDLIRGGLETVRAGLGPWDTGFTAPTFVESPDLPQRSFDASVAERVQRVRDRVDPDGLFRSDVTPGARAA